MNSAYPVQSYPILTIKHPSTNDHTHMMDLKGARSLISGEKRIGKISRNNPIIRPGIEAWGPNTKYFDI